jgi:hypothetical protein
MTCRAARELLLSARMTKKTKTTRPRRRIRRARPLLVVAAGALLLAGCGNDACSSGLCADASGLVNADMGIPPRQGG